MASAIALSAIFSTGWTNRGAVASFKLKSETAFAEEPLKPGQKKEAAPTAAAIKQLAAELEKERSKLMEKEELLHQREERLLVLQKEIEERVATLKEIRLEIGEKVEKLDEFEQQKLLKLVKVYESAPPEEAGNLLSMLDPDLAAKILLKMNNAKAGKLWAFVSPEKAVKISERLYKNKDTKGAH